MLKYRAHIFFTETESFFINATIPVITKKNESSVRNCLICLAIETQRLVRSLSSNSVCTKFICKMNDVKYERHADGGKKFAAFTLRIVFVCADVFPLNNSYALHALTKLYAIRLYTVALKIIIITETFISQRVKRIPESKYCDKYGMYYVYCIYDILCVWEKKMESSMFFETE